MLPRFLARSRPLLPLLLLLGAACVSEPLLLPAEQSVAEFDRGHQPPLYQLLYDTPATPRATAGQQRVRILIWLRHMDLSDDQLVRLEQLRQSTGERAARLDAAEAEIVGRTAEQEEQIYTQLWESLSQGVAVNAPEMGDLTEELRNLRAGGSRERELLALRLEGVRSILDAEQEFLRTLSVKQEAMFTDSLFFLRYRLDPVANPLDFKSLVGSVYEPGQFDVLTRGRSEAARERLNIGALWSDDPGVDAHELHSARREVLLFMALLEPGLEEAIATARVLSVQRVPVGTGSPGEPPSGGPTPAEPPPGEPPPGEPTPAEPPPGEPPPGEPPPAEPPPGEPPSGTGEPTPAPGPAPAPPADPADDPGNLPE
jgi:hypothetical protein